MRRLILLVAIASTGCGAISQITAPSHTEGDTGPVEVVTDSFDYHCTIKDSSGWNKELYYSSVNLFEVGSVIDLKWACSDSASPWTQGGLLHCEITGHKTIRGGIQSQQDQAKKTAVDALAKAGYYEISVYPQEDGNIAFAKSVGAESCPLNWSARKVGSEYHAFGLICGGKVYVDR